MTSTNTDEAIIRPAGHTPELNGLWDGDAWRDVAVLEVGSFHPHSSDHRPRTRAKLLYDERGLYVHFRVEDRYVRSVQTSYQALVCKDSCVEFFIQPKPVMGYFNFEINCGGNLLLYYIEDSRRTPTGFARFEPVPWELTRSVTIYHSMPATVSTELPGPLTWSIEYFIPFPVLEHYVGAIGPVTGQRWRGNLYKCGDETSHPHWASWRPVGDELNFHQPQRFGWLTFASQLPPATLEPV